MSVAVVLDTQTVPTVSCTYSVRNEQALFPSLSIRFFSADSVTITSLRASLMYLFEIVKPVRHFCNVMCRKKLMSYARDEVWDNDRPVTFEYLYLHNVRGSAE
ncbi:hypothetical protein AcW2_006534 [Taiwanofungus camphoratus]|nr:hypothetical protein AcW2_006534 [Antrodia cinnamomea]